MCSEIKFHVISIKPVALLSCGFQVPAASVSQDYDGIKLGHWINNELMLGITPIIVPIKREIMSFLEQIIKGTISL